MVKRLDKHERLWRIAFQLAEQSTCDRAKHGCVVAKNGLILSTGFNGSVDGEKHCDEVGHLIVREVRTVEDPQGTSHCARAIHAEKNAVVNAAITGQSIQDADWYITGVSCWECSKLIARTKPRRIHMCSTRGGERGPDPIIMQWWAERAKRLKFNLRFTTEEKLAELGVVEEKEDEKID